MSERASDVLWSIGLAQAIYDLAPGIVEPSARTGMNTSVFAQTLLSATHGMGTTWVYSRDLRRHVQRRLGTPAKAKNEAVKAARNGWMEGVDGTLGGA